ncbi:chromatin assembly factor 1 subunit A-domain-containing protein [Bombardia bombarda]|uniref:Chromatin assembly factor 1 subunit A-domain-containing protein n=1 Tax=Bombardia bombarda TaxID=252184 RepID=A0AA39WI89_9PEZI|nr:chromatin assembly factor 1 subunit A-domain-containing protein [Bombardia bombarda]
MGETQSTVAKTTAPPRAATTGEPAPKRKKLTAAERVAKEQEREALKVAKAVELAKAEAKKLQLAEEREKKKREKEEVEQLKAQQKAAKEAERKQQREEREKKKREKEEDDAKKARSQIKLTSMFKMNKEDKSVSKPENVADAASPAGTPAKIKAKPATKEMSFYEQTFKPFYVKENVKVAANPYVADEETKNAKTKILDEYVTGTRQEVSLGPFDPVEALQIPFSHQPRGRLYLSVRKIMAEFHDQLSSTTVVPTTADSQNSQIRSTCELLKTVPVKSLKFREDVRPPYIGTVSSLVSRLNDLRKLARNPTSKKVVPLNYDYDSEAEWQEEDGEDIDELDDEDEEGDVDEEMDDFLDDSEDAAPTRRHYSDEVMAPVNTGLCWENPERLNDTSKMNDFRLEFILESLETHATINPFSSEYWAPPPKVAAATRRERSSTPTATASSVPAAASATALPSGTAAKTTSDPATMAPPPTGPSDAFDALAKGAAGKKPAPPLSPDMVQELVQLLKNKPNLSKLGIIELFSSEHAGCKKAQVKASFDNLTEKSGKSWRLKT